MRQFPPFRWTSSLGHPMKLSRTRRPFRSRPLSALTLTGGLGALAIVACTSSSDDGGFFFPFDTSFATSPGVEATIVGSRMAFLADEATTGGAGGSMLNTDGDTTDQVAIVVDTRASTMAETNLQVAARSIHLIANEVFLVVDEAEDMVDWDNAVNPGLNERVLLHWSELAGVVTYVDTLAGDTAATADDGAPDVLVSGSRLYYRSAVAGAMMGETSLSFVDFTDPTNEMRVFDVDGANLDPIPFAADDGILFCVLDETAEATDLNGDGDIGMDGVPAAHDERVVALVDTTDPASMLRSTGLAILPGLSLDDVPVRARPLGTGDWIVAFLVSEIAHNDLVQAGGFNDPLNHNASFQPVHCAGPDADLNDEVLHWIRFALWDADPMMDPPVNTGLSGIAQVSMGGRVVATAGSPPNVGTLELEAAMNGQNCDLNNDMDMTDTIFRWVETGDPMAVTYLTNELDLVAVDTTTAGGASGVGELANVFCAVIDETADGRDYNGDAGNDFDVLAFFDPAVAGAGGVETQWVSDQDSTIDEDYIICDWMAETPTRTTLNSSFGERGSMLINPATGNEDLNEDMDTNDFIPVVVSFGGTDLNFAGPLCATSPANAGIVQANGLTFFRASEAAESRDLNGDMDTNDFVLMRTSLSTSFTTPITTVTNAMQPVIDVSDDPFNQIAGAFEANELLDGIDHNDDNGGVADDPSVLRFFNM